MSRSSKDIKLRIIAAGHKAVDQLIKVAEEEIIKADSDGDISADKLKNAAMTKKLAIFDAFEILSRIDAEQENIDTMMMGDNITDTRQGFAERRSRK